jgi:hypothetical protein
LLFFCSSSHTITIIGTMQTATIIQPGMVFSLRPRMAG